MLDIVKPYLDKIDNQDHKKRLEDLLLWYLKEYPNLELVHKWNQPMLLDHGVFMLGFNVSKKHISIAPEFYGMVKFADDIDKASYERSKMMFKIKWEQAINYDLLKKIIQFKMDDRMSETSFWK